MQTSHIKPNNLQRVCVYCGARSGSKTIYAEEAYALGEALARAGIELVFGGGGQGIMGAVSQGVLDAGGRVTGIIPEALMRRELGRSDIGHMQVVANMHSRKQLMADLADAFVALPGGLGTMDELYEMMTWAQLGFHQKPIALLNTAGYFDDWLKWLKHMEGEGFYHPEELGQLLVADTAQALIQQLRVA
ncbi:MAG: hypothetical protein RLZZ502_568 [Pseudomonadota bacterium]|jgi:uncharacterized protein (TIGR00730 family)